MAMTGDDFRAPVTAARNAGLKAPASTQTADANPFPGRPFRENRMRLAGTASVRA